MGLPAEIDPLLISTTAVSSYQVGRSLRFRSSASAYLNRTPASAGSSTKFTWSGWVKRGAISVLGDLFSAGTGDNNRTLAFFQSDNTLIFGSNNSGTYYGTVTTAVFRDPSAWYHIVFSIDTTQATTANRVRIYVNNVEQTATSAWNSGYIPQNTTTYINTTNPQVIGANPTYGVRDYYDGYLAEVNLIDGSQLTPSSFGAYDTNGVWQPIKYTGSYGTNGFYLPFNNGASTTTLGYDASGNGNNWTTNNISLTSGTTYDWMQDVPTNNSASAANFCTFNPVSNLSGSITNANMSACISDSSGNMGQGTFGMSSGKWYWEATMNSTRFLGGIRNVSNAPVSTTSVDPHFAAGTGSYGFATGTDIGTNYDYYNASTPTRTSTTMQATTGVVVQFAFDATNGKLWLGLNGTWQSSGNPSSGTGNNVSPPTGNTYVPMLGLGNSSLYGVDANFGQRPFSYTPPTGFNALNTANLPTPLISNGAQYMAATLYTGTGSNITIANSQSNGGNNPLGKTFYPDFVWTKGRSAATNNIQIDSVRGGANYLISDSTSAEVNNAAAAIQSFSSTGYVMGTGGAVNTNGATYVAWQWLAGAGSSSSNTNGSITSTVSVNASSGFSIATYTGTDAAGTIGHGLGVAPSMIITKNKSWSAGTNWGVYHTSVGATKFLQLNTTSASITGTAWNNTAPTSSVFSVGGGSYGESNYRSGDTFVAYCFAAVRGYSAFGSYTGNGSTDGPFVFTNFRPRFVLIKDTAGIADWNINDSSRDTYNQMAATLFADASSAESTQTAIDFLSNGFKIRGSTGQKNSSGTTYIYAAFAENPFNYSRAR